MSIPSFHEFSKAPHAQPTSPQRPKHLQTRSITEISSALPRIHGHHHKHHHHHPHVHHKDKGSRDLDRSATAQLIYNAQGSLGLPHDGVSRSEGNTPAESRMGSRHGSLGGGDDVKSRTEMGGRRERPVTEGEVRDERERGVLRATELRNALNGLNTVSINTTRRLDMTYYSVLEKLTVLQNTITSLKEIANLTRSVNEDFNTEAQEVESDATNQLDGFSAFTDQESRISALKSRVERGRAKISQLGERVDVVRERVDGWEIAEGEWQEKTRKRLRWMWIVMSVGAAMVVAAMAFQYTPARTNGPGVLRGLNASGLLGKIPDMEGLRNETWSLKRETGVKLKEMMGRDEELEEDPRLRVFDEL